MAIASGQVKGRSNPDINETLQLSSGVLTVTGPGKKIIQAETGLTDQVEQISGLLEGEKVTLTAESGQTISMTTGTYLKLQWNFYLYGNNTIELESVDGDIAREVSRADITEVEGDLDELVGSGDVEGLVYYLG